MASFHTDLLRIWTQHLFWSEAKVKYLFLPTQVSHWGPQRLDFFGFDRETNWGTHPFWYKSLGWLSVIRFNTLLVLQLKSCLAWHWFQLHFEMQMQRFCLFGLLQATLTLGCVLLTEPQSDLWLQCTSCFDELVQHTRWYLEGLWSDSSYYRHPVERSWF